MSEVNVELYELLKDRECHLYQDYKNNQITAWVVLYHFDLQDFCKAVGPYYFDEGGAECKLLQDGEIAIDLNEIIEGEGHLLSAYAECFEEWEEYREEILKLEKN
ncbi:MAG: hypothetical protein ACOCQR_02225 [bacterium]